LFVCWDRIIEGARLTKSVIRAGLRIIVRTAERVYRMALKSKPVPNDQKLYYIVLKPVSEIRFIRHITV